MSSHNRHGVISSFFLFAAVFLFATSASATEVPFEKLPFGIPLHSEQPADGAVSSAAPSNGPGAGDLTVRRPGAPAGAAVVLAAYRTPAVRDPQPRYGVPMSTGSFGPLPFFPFGNSGSSSSGTGSSGSRSGHTGVDDPTDLTPFPIPGDDESGDRHWGDADDTPGSGDVDRSSAPVPEPSAVLVFGLGALLVKSATRRRQR